MMMHFENELLEQINLATDLVTLIQEYLPLQLAGTNYRGQCPFCNIRQLSFSVSQSKGLYKCYECGKAGHLFTFVQDFEHISLRDAIKKVGLRAGIVVLDEDLTPNKKEK